MNQEAFEKVLRISEEFFGTASDPDQMPINQESADKLQSIHPETISYKCDEQQHPIAWTVVVPTSVDVMKQFIHKKISEKELLDLATKEKKFESIYLCGIFVLPEFRRKGYATEIVKEAISKVSQGNNLPLYSWAYSPEGQKLLHALSQELKQKIMVLQD